MYLSRKVERTFILRNQQKDTKRNNNSAFQNDNECAAMTRRIEKYIYTLYTHGKYFHFIKYSYLQNIPTNRTGSVLRYYASILFSWVLRPQGKHQPQKTMRFLYPYVHRWHKVTGVLLTLDTIWRQNTFCFKNYIKFGSFFIFIIILPPRLPFSDFYHFNK